MRFFTKPREIKKSAGFIEQPEEILLSIFSYLTIFDLACLSATNRKLHRLSNHDALWKNKLTSDFNIILENKCKENYKLLSLYNKYKNFFPDKESLIKQLKNLVYDISTIPLQIITVPNIHIQNNIFSFLFPYLSNYLLNNNAHFPLTNTTVKSNTFIKSFNKKSPGRTISDFEYILNTLNQTQQSLPEEKIKQIINLTKKFMKTFITEFSSEQTKQLIKDNELRRRLRHSNFHDKIILKVYDAAEYIKKHYLTSYYTPPVLILSCLAVLPQSIDYTISGKLLICALNYLSIMGIIDMLHHKFGSHHIVSSEHLENKNVDELKELFNETFSSTPKL